MIKHNATIRIVLLLACKHANGRLPHEQGNAVAGFPPHAPTGGGERAGRAGVAIHQNRGIS